MSSKKVDVHTMPLKTDPAWSPLTMFSVNLLDVNTHTHGNKRYYKAEGPTFVSHGDACVLFHRVMKHFGKGSA
jgi:hypothetical protein